MPSSTLRAGTKQDTDWLYLLFKETNREYIDATWGWDELFQREAFQTNLPGNQFQILEYDNEPVGGYHLTVKRDHLWLEVILVKPEFQRRGFGTAMMEDVKERSRASGLPVHLNVLRINHALDFYLQQGFRVLTDGPTSLKLEWSG